MFFFSSRRRHTRYIGDWSSDVCSSDLGVDETVADQGRAAIIYSDRTSSQRAAIGAVRNQGAAIDVGTTRVVEIGRASCRERVYISEGAVCVKKSSRIEENAARPYTTTA